MNIYFISSSPVIGILAVFRERATLGVFGADRKIFRPGTCTQTPIPPSSSRRPLPPPGPQYRMEINNSWLVIRAGSIEWLLMESGAE